MATQYASGFGEALSTFLAQGGSRRTDKRGTRYMKGPIRGMTIDEATAKAKEMWRDAPDSVKEKYAAQGRDGLMAPSEKAAGMQQRQQGDDGRQRRDDGGGQRFMDRALAVPDGQGGMAPVGGEMEEEEVDDEVAAAAPARTANPRATAGAGRGRPVGSAPAIRPGMGAAAPADNGNMDAEIAGMTTPAMRDEMAAQLGMGEGMSMAMVGGTPGSMDVGASRALNRNTDQVERQGLIESGAADPKEFEAVDAAKAETQRHRAEKDAQVRAEAEARRVASQRERAGLPATPSVDSPVQEQSTAPTPPTPAPATPPAQQAPSPNYTPQQNAERVAADTKEILDRSGEKSDAINHPRASDEARRAGYLGKNAEERYRADMAKGAVPSQEPRMPSMGNNPREVAAYKAEAAMRPGVQRQIAQQTIAQRQTAPPTAADNARGQASQALAERQRNPGISMAEVEGLGQMAAWGVNPQTGQQLNRSDLAGLRTERGLNPAGQIDQPRMAAQISQPRRRPAGSRR